MMTTQGGIPYPYALAMTDVERMRCLQRCIDHNESMEAKHGANPSGQAQDRF